MLLDIRKIDLDEHNFRCDWHNEHGYCDAPAKFIVAGAASCNKHLGLLVKRELEDE